MSFPLETSNPKSFESSTLISPSQCEQGLLGLANATRVLLRHSNLSAAFPRALEHLRAAVQADRLYVCKHEESGFHLKFEALSSHLPPRLSDPKWQVTSYGELGLQRWHNAFRKNRCLGGTGHHFSERERHFLDIESEEFGWFTPIRIPDGELWGFLGCEHQHPPPYFGSCEKPLLLSLADNLGCAIGRQRGEQQIQHQAFHDLLTGLPNRMLFNDRLPLAIAHARRTQEPVAVMFLDLDKFKQINDTLGHDYGDQILVQATQRLKACLREEDILARWGGDEFTLCLPNLQSSDDVVSICQRLLTVLRQPFDISGEFLQISGSIGIALYPQDGEDTSLLLRNADEALYRVKQQGRDHYQFFRSEMNSLATEKRAWAQAISRALSETSLRKRIHQEFALYYQPLIRWVDGKAQVYAVEALLRWQHPKQGLLIAADFLDYAEQTGLMVEIGHWVIESVSAELQNWCNEGIAIEFVSINLSAQQFQSSTILKRLTQLTQSITPGCPIQLMVEVNANTLFQDLNYSHKVTAVWQEKGIGLILQGFGAGSISLEALVQLPVKRLKLDRFLVLESDHSIKQTSPALVGTKDSLSDQEINREGGNHRRQIIAALLSLAKQLSMPVVAVGVELQSQVNLLRSLHCPEAQGNLFSPPVHTEDVPALFSDS